MTDEAVQPWKRPNLTQRHAMTLAEVGRAIAELVAAGADPDLPLAIAVGFEGYLIGDVEAPNDQVWLNAFRESPGDYA